MYTYMYSNIWKALRNGFAKWLSGRLYARYSNAQRHSARGWDARALEKALRKTWRRA